MGDTYGLSLRSEGESWVIEWQGVELGRMLSFPGEREASGLRRLCRVLLERQGVLSASGVGLTVNHPLGQVGTSEDSVTVSLRDLVNG